MDAAFSWIGQIIHWFGMFIPQVVLVKSTHRAVKFIRGWKTVVLEPGMHIYWPFTTMVDMMPVARQTHNLVTQVLVTKDGKTVTVGVVLVYRIDDVLKAIVENWDHTGTMTDICMTSVVSVITGNTLENLISKISGDVENELTKIARRQLKPFGIAVDRCAVTDFSPCRCIKLLDGKGQ